jgi:transposase
MNTQRRFDLTDTEWKKIEPFLPPEHSGKPGHPYVDHRRILNGIRWVMRTGAPWADMPDRYGSPKTCFDRFRRWQRDGTWARLHQALAGAAVSRDAAAIGDIYVDSVSTKVHPHAAGARKRRAKPLKRGAKSLSRFDKTTSALAAAAAD